MIVFERNGPRRGRRLSAARVDESSARLVIVVDHEAEPMRESVVQGWIVDPDTLSVKCGILRDHAEGECGRGIRRFHVEDSRLLRESVAVNDGNRVVHLSRPADIRQGKRGQSEQLAEEVANGGCPKARLNGGSNHARRIPNPSGPVKRVGRECG